MYETPSWKLESRPLLLTPHKHLYLGITTAPRTHGGFFFFFFEFLKSFGNGTFFSEIQHKNANLYLTSFFFFLGSLVTSEISFMLDPRGASKISWFGPYINSHFISQCHFFDNGLWPPVQVVNCPPYVHSNHLYIGCAPTSNWANTFSFQRQDKIHIFS